MGSNDTRWPAPECNAEDNLQSMAMVATPFSTGVPHAPALSPDALDHAALALELLQKQPVLRDKISSGTHVQG